MDNERFPHLYVIDANERQMEALENFCANVGINLYFVSYETATDRITDHLSRIGLEFDLDTTATSLRNALQASVDSGAIYE